MFLSLFPPGFLADFLHVAEIIQEFPPALGHAWADGYKLEINFGSQKK